MKIISIGSKTKSSERGPHYHRIMLRIQKQMHVYGTIEVLCIINNKSCFRQLEILLFLHSFIKQNPQIVKNHEYYTDIDRDGHEISRFGGLPRVIFSQGVIFSRSAQR